MTCLFCNGDLDEHDTFGNLDYAMEASGIPRGEFSRPRNPVKRGEIFRCEPCEEYFYMLDGDRELREGYPC